MDRNISGTSDRRQRIATIAFFATVQKTRHKKTKTTYFSKEIGYFFVQ